MIEEKISVKDKLIMFFKDPKRVISFFLPIIIAVCLVIPVPYYIKMGGGTIEIDDNIKIDNSYSSDGSLEALYVREGRGIVLTYLLSYVIPSFEREKIEDVTLENEDVEDYDYRERLYFTSSLDAATKVAFEKAGKEVRIASSDFVVLYIDKIAKTNLEVGDKIVSVDDKNITSYDDIVNVINDKSEGESVNITVNRDGELVDTSSTLSIVDGKIKMGVVLSNEIKYESNPEVEFLFDGNQAGPSGGLMISLSIYNKLVSEDITKGKKVVGTGTIDTLGNVGAIGGIKQKLYGADKANADVVIVPFDNYNEAKKIKDEEGYQFNLISVKTFDEALEKLEKLD